jgi:hypothetical protein
MAEAASRYRREGAVSLIEIRLASVQQLFNSFDPSPFHEKDLDADAEEYIVDAVREFSLAARLKLVFYLPPDQLRIRSAEALADSIHNYFEYRRDAAARDLRFLLREGRRTLVIGLVFLSACLAVREVLLAQGGTLTHIVGESLLIGGWVALWRPMEILLYEWWPVRRMRQVYAKLTAIPMECRQTADADLSAAPTGRAAG